MAPPPLLHAVSPCHLFGPSWCCRRSIHAERRRGSGASPMCGCGRAGVAAAQWLAVRLQSMAAVIVALVAALAAAHHQTRAPSQSTVSESRAIR